MLGIEMSMVIQGLTALTLTSTVVFSVTPKGIQSLIAFSNWLRTKVLNSEVILEVHKLEKRVTYIEGELGVSYEDMDEHKMQH